MYINMPSIKFIFVQDSIPKHKYMHQYGLHLNLEFKEQAIIRFDQMDVIAYKHVILLELSIG